MTIIVEDGSGLPNSNSYGSVADADIYFTDRNNIVWLNLTTAEKEVLLIKASDYINLRFGQLLKSEILVETQALEFPRVDYPLVPLPVLKATYEYAIRANSVELAPDIVRDPSGYQVSRTFQKVGPIEERKDFAVIGSGSAITYYNAYPAVDCLLRPYLKSVAGGVIRN